MTVSTQMTVSIWERSGLIRDASALARGSRRRRGVVFAVLAVVAWTVAGCASGGGGLPVQSAEAAALLASYSGRWTLDEASSSPQIPNPLEGVKDEEPMDNITRNESRAMRRYRRLLESSRMSVADRRATIEVLRRRPVTLVLRSSELGLSYTPSAGAGVALTLPMNGSEVETAEDESRVKSKARWEGSLLVIEHQVVGGGSVRETLEVIGDRMIMSRTLPSQGGDQTQTLAYDRS